MARYRKLEVRTWNDDVFHRLSAAKPNGQTLWLYLLTGPRTIAIPGVVVAREVVMASDLGWSPQGFREAFEEALREGLVEVDWKAGLVLLRKALLDSSGEPRESASPESPNVLKSWAKMWDDVPDCSLKAVLLRRLGSFAEALGASFEEAYRQGFAKALAKASPIQEQEKDAGEGTGTGIPPNPPRGGSTGCSVKPGKRKSDLTELEREVAGRVLGKITDRTGIEYGTKGGDVHVRLVAARLRDGITERELRAVIGYCWAEDGGLGWASKTTGDGELMATYLRPETLFGPKKIAQYLPAAIAWAAKLSPPRRTATDGAVSAIAVDLFSRHAEAS